VHDDAVGIASHFNNLRVVGGSPDRHIRIDFGEDGFDQMNRYVIAAEVNYVKLPHL
jgi:hypothetical protein